MLNRLMGIVPNASEHGYLVDHMLEFCHWFMAILFVGWSCFFFYTIWRFHRGRNPKANYHGVQSKASAHIEFMVVLIEAVLGTYAEDDRGRRTDGGDRRLCRYWTLGLHEGLWRVLNVEERAQGQHHLAEPIGAPAGAPH